MTITILSNVGAAVTVDTFTRQQVELTGGDISTTSTTFVDATGMTLTIARTVTGGIFFASAAVNINTSIGTSFEFIRWVDNVTNKTAIQVMANTAGTPSATIPLSGALSSQVIKIQWRVNSGTGTLYGGTSTDITSMMQLAEIG